MNIDIRWIILDKSFTQLLVYFLFLKKVHVEFFKIEIE
jgi:hypothetical protein